MSEFQKTKADTAVSTNGFTVRRIPVGGVLYQDASGQIRIDTELFHKPLRIMLYPQSQSLRSLSSSRRDEVISNVKRALEYLGHPVDVWTD